MIEQQADQGIGTAVHRALRMHGEANREVFRTATRTVLYAEFLDMVERRVKACRARGLTDNANVGLVLEKSVESLATFFALIISGATPGFIDPRTTRELLVEQYEVIGMAAMVCEQNRRAELSSQIGQLLVPTELDIETDSAPVTCDSAVTDPALMLFTSGSTGRPKGVILSHQAILKHALGVSERSDLSDADVLLHLMPIFHTNGLNNQIIAPLLVGATIVLEKKFRPESAVEAIRQWQPTVVTGVPTMFLRMLPFIKEGESFARVRMVRCGSAPIKEDQVKQVESAFGVPVILSYGMSEATCTSTMNPLNAPRHGSVGKALTGQVIRIAKPGTTQEISAGEEGEILIGGDAVMSGYAGASVRSPIEDGWLHTGDLGRLDPDGYLTITGRLKDTIVRGGENISPGAIERILVQHPSIQDCCVVGGPHHDLGEVPVAFVSLAPSSERVDEGELKVWSESRLNRLLVPEKILIIDNLPVTELGKVDRSHLIDLVKG